MVILKVPIPLPPTPKLQICGDCHHTLILPNCLTCAEDIGLARYYRISKFNYLVA